jgi:hypothetical protein
MPESNQETDMGRGCQYVYVLTPSAADRCLAIRPRWTQVNHVRGGDREVYSRVFMLPAVLTQFVLITLPC